MTRESMEFDVVIVGAGPAGLSAAIRLKQLCQANDQNLDVCVIEKGAEVGAHILSGAVLEPRALNELFPNWSELEAPLHVAVTDDRFTFLTAQKAYNLPTPSPMKNHNNYIISLGNFCRWLAQQAEQLGVEIYPGFPASELIYADNGAVIGITTGDMGRDKTGNKKANFQAGMNLFAQQILLAEGCHGSLSKQAIKQFKLRANSQNQTYGLGIKELWEVNSPDYQAGRVMHSVGWPLNQQTYGGSFIYHLDDQKVAIGFVIGLDYKNPYLNPFAEMQRFKTHPAIKTLLQGGKRIAYGARALNEGGLQSIPKLTFPGGALIGDCAGFLNVPKIKGTHTAMKSGMVAAESIFSHLKTSEKQQGQEIHAYQHQLEKSWVWEELHQVRNIRPAFKYGLWPGLAYAAIDTYLLRGKAPWTFKHHQDDQSLLPAKQCKKINYPAPDGEITFDKMSSVYLSNTNHEEDQPCHLQILDAKIPIDVNAQLYASPETHYCPAGVYEIINSDEQARLQINAQNCVHCKTCDIKDPKQNINWVPPEGGGGPNYSEM